MTTEEIVIEEITPKTKTRAKTVKKPTEDQLAAAAALEDDVAQRPVIVKLARIMAQPARDQARGPQPALRLRLHQGHPDLRSHPPRMAAERLMIISEVIEESWEELPTKTGSRT